MASPTDRGLADAWRSLSGSAVEEGWRVIQIGAVAECTLRAGRRFPGNVEALLATFPRVRLPGARQLPQGRGFDVSRVDLFGGQGGALTIALAREAAGSLDLFETMSEDVIAALRKNQQRGMHVILETFLRRVAAWQDFMRKPSDQRLSGEEEVGLYGELLTLERALDAGAPAVDMVESWEGPLDGLQDFAIGNGAIEVKSSIAVTGFPARIGSLEQLDDAMRQPLYLAAQRIVVDPEGASLPDLIAKIRDRISNSGAQGTFELRLKQAGYFDDHAEHYSRQFLTAGERLFLINDSFPRLTPGIVRAGIRSAIYSIDVDQIDIEPVPLEHALRSLEII
jgi:hypothetical protein